MNTLVNFELAKIIKEKEFKNKTSFGYNMFKDGSFHLYERYRDNNSLANNLFSAPTIAEVVMWLYEKHGIFVTVTIPYNEFGKFSAEIWGKESDNIKILLVDGMSVFKTINQAYEEGIIESLKLI